MARYDVYSNPGDSMSSTPYLLDVQSDLLDGLDTRMVIPLRNLGKYRNVELPTQLTPILRVQGEDYLLETPKMAAVPVRVLRSSLESLSGEHDTITGAIDFLFHGF